VLARVAQEQPTLATAIDPALPHEVDVFLACALAKSPADRYQDGNAMARDAEALLEGQPLTLVEHDSPLSALIADASAVPEAAPVPPPAPTPPAAPPVRSARSVRLALAGAALFLSALALVFFVRSRQAPEPPAAAEPAARVAPTVPPQARTTAVPPPAAAPGAGRLAVDFEHHLKSGLLRVFVDGDPVLEEELDAHRTKKILLFTVSQGVVRETLDVAPGRRTIRVQVKWGDNVRQQSVAGTFREGVVRRLKVRVSRLLNDLSVRLE
jgi:hypothetical protein